MILRIWDTLTEWSESFKQFILDNSDKSVIIYTGLFLLGIAIFAFAFSALNKDQQR